MRIIRCVKPMRDLYITVGEDYTFAFTGESIYFTRTVGRGSSYMSYGRFKRALREGEIVFVDNLPKEQQ